MQERYSRASFGKFDCSQILAHKIKNIILKKLQKMLNRVETLSSLIGHVT